jgi:hypothetical protein
MKAKFFQKFHHRVIFYAYFENEMIPLNGPKTVIFDFFAKMTKISIFDFEAL